ncbi:Basal body P-ring protein [Janthinobacterium lividum]|nr:Basal body P-ring protein [Janthinobacterium lividum]
MKFRSALPLAAMLAALSGFALPASAAQVLRNLVSIEGVRDNPLVGYGLVVGLNGSGDTTQVKFSSQSVVNMLKQFGVKMPDGAESKSKNVATVMVSAVFPRDTAVARPSTSPSRRLAMRRACAAAPCC